MLDPEQLALVVSDQVQNFKSVFDGKVSQNGDKISQLFDEVRILTNKLN